MGHFNSSKTRVAPLFDALFDRDTTGASWLDTLLARGSRTDVIATLPRNQRLVPNHGRRWGDAEAALPAPIKLLEYLVENVDENLVSASRVKGKTRALRLALARKDEFTVDTALKALRAGGRGREWFVLEGESRPDALLESDELVLCVEGKRTENKTTTHTSWMRRRSQLVRHMDAALDSFPEKRVLGILIVEGRGGPDDLAPTVDWVNHCAEQHEESMLADSLPHRSPEERRRVGKGILGLTTWQAVCRAVDVPWTSLPKAI